MRILLYTKMFPRPDNDTFGSYVYAQLNEIIKCDETVLVMSPHMYIPRVLGVLGGKFRKYATAPKEYVYKGITVLSPKCLWSKEFLNRYPNLKYYIYKFSMKRKLIAECKRFKPDIIYGLDPLLDGRLCMEVGKHLKIPVVLIEHSVPNNYRNLVGYSKAVEIYSEVISNVNETIYVTNSQKKLFEEIVNHEIRGQVVLNGFINENHNLIVNNNENDIIQIITIGFLEDRKGYPLLFKVLKRLKEDNYRINSIVIGDGYEKNRYLGILKEYEIDHICEFKGILSHQEVYQYLNSSDIFVLPSYEESFGIVYLEAMSCKLPVIATENEGISDIIEDGVNGLLIKKQDEEDLYANIVKLIENPNKRNEISENGYNSAIGLSWEANAKKVVAILNSNLK